MDTTYYEAIHTMEQMGVDRDYMQGWIGGYLKNPKREPQRVTAAYESGYADGLERNTGQFGQWVRQEGK